MLLKEIEYKLCEMKRGGEYDDIASCKKRWYCNMLHIKTVMYVYL